MTLRNTRVERGMNTIMIAITTLSLLGPSDDMISIASSSEGNDSIPSMMRITPSSQRPPR